MTQHPSLWPECSANAFHIPVIGERLASPVLVSHLVDSGFQRISMLQSVHHQFKFQYKLLDDDVDADC